jgi:formate hydrogenlyase subunit 3/multisubunit Na+/H+ antiporter MnhD subunit
MWLSITLILLTLLMVTGLIVAIIHEDGESTLGCICLLILCGVAGWGMAGNIITMNSKYEIISPSITKTKSAVIVEYDGMRTIFEDAKTYNTVTDTTKFTVKTDYNMYGGDCGKSIITNPKVEKGE